MNNYRKHILKDYTPDFCRVCRHLGESLRHVLQIVHLANTEYLLRNRDQDSPEFVYNISYSVNQLYVLKTGEDLKLIPVQFQLITAHRTTY